MNAKPSREVINQTKLSSFKNKFSLNLAKKNDASTASFFNYEKSLFILIFEPPFLLIQAPTQDKELSRFFYNIQ